MDNELRVAQATLEAMLFAQTLRPLAEAAGPAGEYCTETFAQTLMTSMVSSHG